MKKAIVIGASSGIGRGLAKILADNNYKVGITGRREHLLAELANEKPDSFIIKSFDITDLEIVTRKLDELVAELQVLDLLILNSGTGNINETLDFQIEKQTIDTNISGFTLIAGWAFNYFKNQKSGHLAAVTSVAGIRGRREAPAYNASKAYQINYIECIRNKALNLGLPIFITDIRPGFVDTEMAKSPEKFWVAPVNKAAKQIFNAINKKKKVAYITKRWVLIASLIKLIPDFLFKKI